VPDPADRATIEEEHALELRTRDRERKLLKKIAQSWVGWKAATTAIATRPASRSACNACWHGRRRRFRSKRSSVASSSRRCSGTEGAAPARCRVPGERGHCPRRCRRSGLLRRLSRACRRVAFRAVGGLLARQPRAPNNELKRREGLKPLSLPPLSADARASFASRKSAPSRSVRGALRFADEQHVALVERV
jgi:hypothetical protein